MGDYLPHHFDQIFGTTSVRNRDNPAARLLHSNSNDMPLPQVQASATVLAGLLDTSKDEHTLKETCLSLCQLFGDGIQNDRIQSILEADVVPRLVSLLRPPKSKSDFRVPVSVQSAALQVIGNIACGDDRQTQVIIDCQALPCLKALLSSSDRGIRKECCWIVSNITESASQVQDVIEAGVLPPLLKLLESQDAACREDATWVLYNITANRQWRQIEYLADNQGVRALCDLLNCQKTLDVIWKRCTTVSAVALKGLRNILVVGQWQADSSPLGYNRMAALVAEAHGVDRMEALAAHGEDDIRARARLLLERMFGAETSTLADPNLDLSGDFVDIHGGHSPSCTCGPSPHAAPNGRLNAAMRKENESLGMPGYTSSSASCSSSEPDEDDSDSDLIPPPPPPCECVLCKETSPLVDTRAPQHRGLNSDGSTLRSPYRGKKKKPRPICDFCNGYGRLVDSRAGLASKLGRAIRLGHSHCLASLLSRMTWSQRASAVDASTPINPGESTLETSQVPAFILASQMGKYHCLALLLKRTKPDLDSLHGKRRLTALAYAVHKGYYRCGELLLSSGANASARSSESVTALHLAPHPSIVELLLRYNAAVNVKSAKKQTPLSIASQMGNTGIVRLLLEAGADPNIECEAKSTALHLAATGGHLECCEELIRFGARVDAKTSPLAITPLHYAVQGGFASIVNLLVSAGAKVNCSRKPLLVVAADDGNVDVVRILLDALARVDCTASVKAMLGTDHEIQDDLSPLMLAASKGHVEVVRLLVRRGADVNLVSPKGWTPLEFALWNGKGKCAHILLEAGCKVSGEKRQLGCELKNCTMLATKIKDKRLRKDLVTLILKRIGEASDNQPPNADEPPKSGMTTGVSRKDKDNTGRAETRKKPSKATKTGKQKGPSTTSRSVSDLLEIPPAPPLPPISSPVRASSSSHSSHLHCIGGKQEDLMLKRREKRRENDTNDAREKLNEAISLKSIQKLTDAITYSNKLLLHMATSSTTPGGLVGASDSFEAKLNADIDRARGVLHKLQAGERKLRDNREKHAAESRLQGMRKSLSLAINLVLDGADTKTLQKALKSATRQGLPANDEVLKKAVDTSAKIEAGESAERALNCSIASRDEKQLLRALVNAKKAILSLNQGGSKAAIRIFHGDPWLKLDKAQAVLAEVKAEVAAAREAAERRAAAETAALTTLKNSLRGRRLSSIEKALRDASAVVLSDSNTLEDARRQFNRQVKSERKRLRTAAASNDIAKLNRAINHARALEVEALSSEIRNAEKLRQGLADQAQAVKDFTEALEKSDSKLLSEIRTRLESLGLVAESEEARRALDKLDRLKRAKDNLESVVRECHEVMSFWRTEKHWSWENEKPLGRKLCDLLKKAMSVGGMDELIEDSKSVAGEYAQCAREALNSAVIGGNVKEISKGLQGYCKEFMDGIPGEPSGASSASVILQEFSLQESISCIRNARGRMEDVQRKEQEKIRLESEQAFARTSKRGKRRMNRSNECALRKEVPIREVVIRGRKTHDRFMKTREVARTVIPNGKSNSGDEMDSPEKGPYPEKDVPASPIRNPQAESAANSSVPVTGRTLKVLSETANITPRTSNFASEVTDTHPKATSTPKRTTSAPRRRANVSPRAPNALLKSADIELNKIDVGSSTANVRLKTSSIDFRMGSSPVDATSTAPSTTFLESVPSSPYQIPGTSSSSAISDGLFSKTSASTTEPQARAFGVNVSDRFRRDLGCSQVPVLQNIGQSSFANYVHQLQARTERPRQDRIHGVTPRFAAAEPTIPPKYSIAPLQPASPTRTYTRSSQEDACNPSSDLDSDFASQNFGFDIEEMIGDEPQAVSLPPPVCANRSRRFAPSPFLNGSRDSNSAALERMPNGYVGRLNSYYQRKGNDDSVP